MDTGGAWSVSAIIGANPRRNTIEKAAIGEKGEVFVFASMKKKSNPFPLSR
jgi:hypothetical protein